MAVLLFVLMAGCASTRVAWKDRVGNYTYDDTVKEMGPPERKEILADGTIVGEWLLSRGQVYSTYSPSWGPAWSGRRGDWWAPGLDIGTTPNALLRLQFGPDGRLVSWKNVYK